MKYLVTGSAGFIGQALVKKLLINKQNKVYAIDRNFLNLKSKNLIKIRKDIKSIKKFPKVDIVFHLAAFNGTKYFYSKPLDVIDDNVSTTLSLVKFYKTKKLKKFISAGSSEIYAGEQNLNNKKIPHNENNPIIFKDLTNPRWSYSSSKFMSELIVINSGLPYIILRYFNVYGSKQKDHFIPEFISRIKRKKYELYGYKNTRAFIYIDDAVNATIKISKKNVTNQTFNLGSDKEEKIINVAKLIMKVLKIKNRKIKLFNAPKGSVMKRKPDISKLKKVIGNFKTIKLAEGIKKIINKNK